MAKGAGAVPGLKRSRYTVFRSKLAKRFGWLWKPQLLAGVVLGFLMGRALPGAQIAPFGVAFFAAVRGAGFSPAKSLPVAVAVLTGSLTALPFPQVFWVLAALGLCHALSTILAAARGAASPVLAAVVASVSVTVPLVMQPDKLSAVLLVFWSGMTGVLALVFTLGLQDATSGRLLIRGTSDSPVPAIVVLSAALCGLDGLAPWPWLSLRDAAGAMLVMACAYAGGPSVGSAAGAILGVGYLFGAFGAQLPSGIVDGIAPAARGMAYVIAGLLSGTFRDLGKTGVGVAFLMGFVTCVVAIPGQADPLVVLAGSAAAACVLFWMLPAGWVLRLPVGLISSDSRAAEEAEPKSPPVTAGLLDRVRSISRVFKEVSHTFEQVAAVEAPVEPLPRRVVSQVSDRVCQSCSMYQHCWDKELEKTYQLFTDLWAQVDERGPLSSQTLPIELEQHCIYPGQVAFTLTYLHDLHRSHRHWERKIDEGRTVVVDYLRNVSRMLDRFAEDVSANGEPLLTEPLATLRVVSGVARLPKRGSHISGDSFAGEPMGPDRYLMALSDGMGGGREAAVESRQCIRLLQEILRAGFTPEVAVKTVNSALLLHSPDEAFATVDLAMLDLTTGRTEFVKVGAAPSFLKRGADVTVIKVSSVPVGIINHVQVEPEHRIVRPGDLLVMITDGVWDISKDDLDKERWIMEQLRRESSTDPEEVAESLLARAIELLPEATDDMTVLVARVDSASGSAPPSERRPLGTDWIPARVAPRISVENPNRSDK